MSIKTQKIIRYFFPINFLTIASLIIMCLHLRTPAKQNMKYVGILALLFFILSSPRIFLCEHITNEMIKNLDIFRLLRWQYA